VAAALEAEQRVALGGYLATMPGLLQTAIKGLPAAKTADAVRAAPRTTRNDMWNAANTEFGRDTVEIRGSDADGSVHVYEGTRLTGTAIVLHIPSGTS
jgi:hypothetical protein